MHSTVVFVKIYQYIWLVKGFFLKAFIAKQFISVSCQNLSVYLTDKFWQETDINCLAMKAFRKKCFY